MAFETILYEKSENIVKITLNRPEKRNAESVLMSKEIEQAISQVEADDEARVVIIAAAGKDFSAGHDLTDTATKEERDALTRVPKGAIGLEATIHNEHERYLKPRLNFRDMWKVTIAQVQGRVMYGAIQLPMMCDLVLCSDDASFVDLSARWGLPITEFSTWHYDLPMRIQKEYLFTADPITAQEAARWGMVNKVVPREKLEEETMKLAKRLALIHPFTIKQIKMCCNYTQDLQGFRESQLFALMIHQIGHGYARENPQHFPFEGGFPSRGPLPGIKVG